MSIRNTDEAFHRWANDRNLRGGSGNVTFGGGTLFSYSMIIGRHVTDPDTGRSGILITGDSYSVTTAKHISKARNACRRYASCPDGYGLTERTTPAEVRMGWAVDIAKQAANYAEARSKPSKAKQLGILVRHVEQANALCALFGLEPFAPVPEDTEVAAYIEGHAARELARRAAETAERTREREEREARVVEDMARERTDRELWKAGENMRLSWHGRVRDEDGDIMRIKGGEDGPDTVETSQGAYVPAADVVRAAPMLLRLVARAVETREEWRPRAFSPRLGHYTVDRVDADGTLHVGCHAFKRAEVERFAAVLGVAPVAADEIPEGAK